MDQVQAPGLAVEGLDGRHHAAPVPDGGEHADAGDHCAIGRYGCFVVHDRPL